MIVPSDNVVTPTRGSIMKLINVLTKNFPSVEDYMDVNEDDNRVLFLMVSKDEDQCEPDYSVNQYIDGSFVVRNLMGEVLLETNEENEVKKFIKVLAK